MLLDDAPFKTSLCIHIDGDRIVNTVTGLNQIGLNDSQLFVNDLPRCVSEYILVQVDTESADAGECIEIGMIFGAFGQMHPGIKVCLIDHIRNEVSPQEVLDFVSGEKEGDYYEL